MTFSPRYRALVYASLFASFLVVVWGGIVRVTGSGLGCPDWPLCHGQFLPSLDPATRIEWTHRFLAIVSGLTVAAMDEQPIRSVAVGAGQALGMKPGDQLAVAGLFIQQIDDGEIHGDASRVATPKPGDLRS